MNMSIPRVIRCTIEVIIAKRKQQYFIIPTGCVVQDTAKIAVPQVLILLLSQEPSFQKAHNLNLAASEGYE